MQPDDEPAPVTIGRAGFASLEIGRLEINAEGSARATVPTPPLVLMDAPGLRPGGRPSGGDPMTFGSMDSVLRFIEAIDVRDGTTELFDAEARPIKLEAASDFGPITWTLQPERYAAELEQHLRAHVRRVGPTRLGLIDADLPLDGLLRAMWRFEHHGAAYPRDSRER